MLNSDVESSSRSDSDDSPNEWLANGRSRRSNAGNRMTRLIGANEVDSVAEDDDLNLLFAEDGQEDDADFREDRMGYSSELDLEDSTPDESSESEDDFQGERELERENRVSKKRQRVPNLAQRYTRLNRIKPNPESEVSAPAALKKTHSIPSDRQVRISSRTRTLLSRRGARETVPRTSIVNPKSVRATKVYSKSPLTQGERLAKAHQIEVQNSKSLHHWQDAENVRLQQQRDRLSELRGRGIDGPVVRWYSGPAQFANGTPLVVGKKALQYWQRGQMAGSSSLPKRPDPERHLKSHNGHELGLTPVPQDRHSAERLEIDELWSPTNPNLKAGRTGAQRDHEVDILQTSNSSTTTGLSTSNTRPPCAQPKLIPVIDYEAQNPQVTKPPDDDSLQEALLQSDNQREHLGVYNVVRFHGLKAEDGVDPFITSLVSRRREPRTRINKPLIKNCSVTGTMARYRDPFTRLPFATPASYHMIARLLCDNSRFNCDLGIYVGSAQDDSTLNS